MTLKHFAIDPSTFPEPISCKAVSEHCRLQRAEVQAARVSSSKTEPLHPTRHTQRRWVRLFLSAVWHRWGLHSQIQRVFILSIVVHFWTDPFLFASGFQRHELVSVVPTEGTKLPGRSFTDDVMVQVDHKLPFPKNHQRLPSLSSWYKPLHILGAGRRGEEITPQCCLHSWWERKTLPNENNMAAMSHSFLP